MSTYKDLSAIRNLADPVYDSTDYLGGFRLGNDSKPRAQIGEKRPQARAVSARNESINERVHGSFLDLQGLSIVGIRSNENFTQFCSSAAGDQLLSGLQSSLECFAHDIHEIY